MKTKELREFSGKELDAKLRELRKNILDLRFQAKIGQMEKPSQIRAIRKGIARTLTVVNEKAAKKEGVDEHKSK